MAIPQLPVRPLAIRVALGSSGQHPFGPAQAERRAFDVHAGPPPAVLRLPRPRMLPRHVWADLLSRSG